MTVMLDNKLQYYIAESLLTNVPLGCLEVVEEVVLVTVVGCVGKDKGTVVVL